MDQNYQGSALTFQDIKTSLLFFYQSRSAVHQLHLKFEFRKQEKVELGIMVWFGLVWFGLMAYQPL